MIKQNMGNSSERQLAINFQPKSEAASAYQNTTDTADTQKRGLYLNTKKLSVKNIE